MTEGMVTELWSQFHFLRPWWALLAPPLAWLWFHQRSMATRESVAHPAIAAHVLKALSQSRREQRRLSPNNLFPLLMGVLVIILMGPSWSRQPSPFEEDRAAVYLALDLSPSMAATDIQPSRMERAKQKIRDLLALRPAGRHGLVVYAGSAHSVLPLTSDSNILTTYLGALTPDIIPVQGKFAETILPVVAKSEKTQLQKTQFQKTVAEPVTIVLFSDGVGSETIPAFATFFQAHPWQLIVLPLGENPEKAQPGSDSEPPTDNTIPLDIVPLDKKGLEKLTQVTGGHLVSLSLDDEDVKTVNRLIRNHRIAGEEQAVPWIDSGYYLVFVAMLLFLPWFRRGWTLNGMALPLLLGAGLGLGLGFPREAKAGEFMDLWLTPDQQGRWYFEQGDYARAAEHFDDIAWKATAYYLAEDFPRAAEYFSRINSDDALFSQANAQAHGQNYLPAIRIYNRLLARRPDYPGAAHNRDIVQALVDAINQASASQQAEASDSDTVLEQGELPDRAQGAEREFLGQEQEQYSAEQLLQDKSLDEQWMRAVEPEPSRFLAVKFYLQLEQQSGGSNGETRP